MAEGRGRGGGLRLGSVRLPQRGRRGLRRDGPRRFGPGPAAACGGRVVRLCQRLPSRTSWRNGSASDSRSEGCVFESRRGHGFPSGGLFYTRGRGGRAGPRLCGDRDPELRRGSGPGARCRDGAVGLGSPVHPTEGLGQAAARGLVLVHLRQVSTDLQKHKIT